MEDWTEDNLFKLTVKELKSLARKVNVNPNYKKTELVKALLTTTRNVKDDPDRSESVGDQKSKRMTRSRVSMWLPSDETADTVNDVKSECKEENGNSDAVVKVTIEDKRTKKRKVKEAGSSDAYNTAEMFPLVSCLQLASKPLVEITNKNIVRHELEKQDEVQTDIVSKKSKRTKGMDKKKEEILPLNKTGLNAEPSVLNTQSFVSNEQKGVDLNGTFVVEEGSVSSQDIKRTNKKRKIVEQVQGNERLNLSKSKQSEEQHIVNEDYTKTEENKDELADGDKKETKKPKRGKKRKSKSPVNPDNYMISQESSGPCNSEAKSQSPSRSRSKKDSKHYEGSEIRPCGETSQSITEVKLTDKQLHEVSNTKDSEIKQMSASNSTENYSLNGTFVVEEGLVSSQDIKRTNKKRKIVEQVQGNERLNLSKSKQSEEQPIVNVDYTKTEENKDELAAGDKKETKKPKRGKKRKSKSPVNPDNYMISQESSGPCNSEAKSQSPSRSRSKKDSKHYEGSEIRPCDETSQSITEVKLTDKQLHEVSNTKDSEIKQMSASNSTENYSSKKRKISTSPVLQISNDESGSNCAEPNQNKSKRRKGIQQSAKNIPSSPLNLGGKRKKQESSVEIESSQTQQLSEPVQTTINDSSCVGRNSRRSKSMSNSPKEFKVVNGKCEDSLENSSSMTNLIEKDNVLDKKDASPIESESGQKSIQTPLRRSSTFILSDSAAAQDTEEMPVPAPRRNATFTLTGSGGKSHRSSFKFSPKPAFEKKAALSQDNGQPGKSIGHRIMQNSTVKHKVEKSSRKEQGSVFKKRPTSKMPDFKKIHQQLFNNMESVSECKKRQQIRAQILLQSPVVPRCALLSPKPTIRTNADSSPMRRGVAPSPLATKLKTPVASGRKPVPAVTRTPSVAPTTSSTPTAMCKPLPTSVNRFGFRKPLKKEEALSIVGKKLPPINLEKKKEQERSVLKGVRTNKRFMLQMQMRQHIGKDSGK